MKTREQVIDSMCLTWRHDFGIEKGRVSGMTEEEKQSLRARMTQIFDNDIAPYMEFKKTPRKTELIHDGIIKIYSFEFTEREKRRMALGLRYGPAAAAMKDDGTYFDPPEPGEPEGGYWKWLIKKFSSKK